MSLEVDREEVVQTLCAHYAQDHLSTGELEARFERVYQSSNRAQLRTVLEGLPAIGPLAVPPAPMYQVADRPSGLPVSTKRYLALFSEVKKEGHWTPADFLAVRAIMGGVVLDFRDAELPPGGIEIDVDVIMGEAKILLPPGIGADVDCSAILGSVEDKARPPLPGSPIIRVRGNAVMGSIVVVTKIPKPARLESWRSKLKGLLGVGGRYDMMGRPLPDDDASR